MRVHRAPELVGRRLELHRHASFGNQLRRVWPNDVHAKNLVILLLADDLYEAFFFTNYASFA